MGILAVTWATRVMGVLASVTMVAGLAALWIAARRNGKGQQHHPGRASSVLTRYLGLLPINPTKLERLVWVRRFSLRIAGPWIPVVIALAVYFDAIWFYIVVGAMLVLWLESLVGLSVNIRREFLKNGPNAS
jgi:hypothetical protein